MRKSLSFLALIGSMIAGPVAAQSVGMAVVDTAGAPVGSVTAIKGDNVLIKTDKHEALLPKASFTVNGGKLLFGMTQAQLNAQIESSVAASKAAIVVGATVNGAAGASVGKIEAIGNGQVTIALTSGKRIQVAETALRGNADGSVVIGYTAEQIDALVNKDASSEAAGQ
jgi:hypothetical protein